MFIIYSHNPDLGSFVCVIRFHGRRILIGVDVSGARLDAKSKHYKFHSHRSRGKRKIFGMEFSDKREEKEKLIFIFFFLLTGFMGWWTDAFGWFR